MPNASPRYEEGSSVPLMDRQELNSQKYNQRLAAGIFLLSVVIGLRLFQTGIATDNMAGFYYSLLHVVIVAAGSFLALRK